MNAFTKLDAIKLVSLKTGQSQAVVKGVINALFEEFKDALVLERKVEIRGFGVLETRISQARVGRNPSHPEKGNIVIPSKRIVRFRVAPDLAKAVAKVPVKGKKVLTAEPIHDVT